MDLTNKKIWIGHDAVLGRRVLEYAKELGWEFLSKNIDGRCESHSFYFNANKSICFSSGDNRHHQKEAALEFIHDPKEEIYPNQLFNIELNYQVF